VNEFEKNLQEEIPFPPIKKVEAPLVQKGYCFELDYLGTRGSSIVR
jgi:hypothetical protein